MGNKQLYLPSPREMGGGMEGGTMSGKIRPSQCNEQNYGSRPTPTNQHSQKHSYRIFAPRVMCLSCLSKAIVEAVIASIEYALHELALRWWCSIIGFFGYAGKGTPLQYPEHVYTFSLGLISIFTLLCQILTLFI